MNRQELIEQIKEKKSLLCVGLDTDINKIPTHLLDCADPIFEFNKEIIDATQAYTVAYKPNTAFYSFVLLFSHVGHVGSQAGSSDTLLK